MANSDSNADNPDARARLTGELRRMSQVGAMVYGPEDAGPWYEWGPYLAERAWGTVREDYSDNGDAWSSFPYEHAVSRAYRWSDDGIAGYCDIWQDISVAMAFWNGRDSHLKERLFGLSSHQGNHGEDVKEYYWYTDATPSHAWLSYRYHYPQAAFPYEDLIRTNGERDRTEPEYELIDTGVFDNDAYWIIEVDYAKNEPTDTSIRIRVTNAGTETDTIHVIPQLWFRDTWSWGRRHRRPEARSASSARAARARDGDPAGPADAGPEPGPATILAEHYRAGLYHFEAATGPDGQFPTALFCENESNAPKLWDNPATTKYPKDGINDHVIHGADTVNPEGAGTKSAWWYRADVEPGQTVEFRLRLWSPTEGDVLEPDWAGATFDELMATRRAEADEFYAAIAPPECPPEQAAVMRQAFAGMIWGKQFYRYDVKLWLDGDPDEPPPPPGHRSLRNTDWRHFDAYDVLTMPDPWEYCWFAAWDSAFHTVVFAHIDPSYAKYQLSVMLREWYMHPNGAIPAYEWSFNDLNPPVHAWAALRVFEIDGNWDYEFLGSVFQKLLLNFTWWVNRVDAQGNNIFEGGFLGLDNIGPIDRTNVPPGFRIEQADGTSWMALYCLMMLRIALRLAAYDTSYRPMMLKFLEHFAGITDGMAEAGMWDPADGFFYDQLVCPDGSRVPLKVKSVVGVIPVLAAAFLQSDSEYMRNAQRIERRFSQFLQRRGLDAPDPDRAGFVYRTDSAAGSKLLLTVVDPDRLRRVLMEVLSEDSMLSDYGIRSLSRLHLADPFSVEVAGQEFRIDYEPAESATPMYGGNSNWRGPVWFPINHLVIEALERYYMYLGDEFRVECPTGSGVLMNLNEVAAELRRRLISIFLPDETGRFPVYGSAGKFQSDPRWNEFTLFYEYFSGDNGAGIGASHQTGWTGLVADLIIGRKG